jgi:hypothetical protein
LDANKCRAAFVGCSPREQRSQRKRPESELGIPHFALRARRHPVFEAAITNEQHFRFVVSIRVDARESHDLATTGAKNAGNFWMHGGLPDPCRTFNIGLRFRRIGWSCGKFIRAVERCLRQPVSLMSKGANMRTILALALTLATTAAMAQSVGNSGRPARANTTDPNSAPMMGSQGTRSTNGLDAAGRANTSDPNSAMSGGTNASGRSANPTANPRRR